MKTKLSRWIALLLCAVLTVGAMAGCGQNSNSSAAPEGSTATPGSSAAKTEIKEELIISMNNDVKGFDPMKNWQTAAYFVYWTVYERLFYLNPQTGQYEPELAKSWDIAEDGMSYTFYLQENVKWHDGSPFTAKDVKYTVERGIELGTGNYPSVDHVEIVNDYTVKIVMKNPDSVFMDKQWTGDCCVVKEGTDEELMQHPMGTGPFKFVEWVSGDHVTIEAFDGYWREQSGTKKITFRISPEANARLVALQTGELDIAEISAENVSHVTADKNLQLFSTPAATVNYLGFNCSKAPFDNELVRKAICYAIDKDAIVTAQLNGQGTTIKTFVGLGRVGRYDELESYTYDPAKAKELLKQAGYENGFECTLTHSVTAYKLAVQLIQANLGDIGITVKIDGVESAAYSEQTKAGNTNLFIGGRGGGSADSYLMMFYGPSLGAQGNVFFYQSAEYDELFEKSHVTTDINARNEIYRQMQEHLNEHAPVLPLYSSIYNLGAQNGVKNTYAAANGSHDYRWSYREITK